MVFLTLPETFFAGEELLELEEGLGFLSEALSSPDVIFALTGVPLVVTLADVFVFDLADVFVFDLAGVCVFDEELPEEPLTYLEFMPPPLLCTTLELSVPDVLGALDAASLADLVLSSADLLAFSFKLAAASLAFLSALSLSL